MLDTLLPGLIALAWLATGPIYVARKYGFYPQGIGLLIVALAGPLVPLADWWLGDE